MTYECYASIETVPLRPKVWLRYVEDSFFLWPYQEAVHVLLDHVNTIRPSIWFTGEKESNQVGFMVVLKI